MGLRLTRRRKRMDLSQPLYIRRPLNWSGVDMAMGDRVTQDMLDENPHRIRQLYRLRIISHMEELAPLLAEASRSPPGPTKGDGAGSATSAHGVAQGQAPDAARFVARHRGNGKWAVLDTAAAADGDPVVASGLTKEAAELDALERNTAPGDPATRLVTTEAA